MSNFPKRLTVRVNVDKVLKEHLYKGQKGNYLNLVLFNTPGNPYGQDFCVKQEVDKDLRADVETEIIGEAKAWALGEGSPTPKGENSGQGGAGIVDALRTIVKTPAKTNTPPVSDDLPF